jgi:DNA-binding response OmpR family regulator
LIQAEGEVEALRVVVATSIFDGESIASEPYDCILLRIVLGDSQGLEFFWEKQIVKSSREGGEAVVLACRGGLLASYFFNSAVGIVAAA